MFETGGTRPHLAGSPWRGSAAWCGLVAALALAAPAAAGCNIFDKQLALRALDGGGSHGDTDGGHGDEDAGLFPIADRCGEEAPLAASSEDPLEVPMDELRDDYSMFASCGIGHLLTGSDGFFAIQVLAGQRWHINARPEDPAGDVSLYALPACDERSCAKAADHCGAGNPEHMNFVARTGGRYFIGVESDIPEMVMVMAVSPPCGNGMRDHGETCDDGNSNEGDGCDPRCRAELLTASSMESEPNDDEIEANVIRFPGGGDTGTMVIQGTLGGPCDMDRFSIRAPAGASIRATALDEAGAPCGASTPEMMMMLAASSMDVSSDLGEGESGGAGGSCPAIGPEASFARGLQAGEYLLMVEAPGSPELFQYTLRIEVMPPTG